MLSLLDRSFSWRELHAVHFWRFTTLHRVVIWLYSNWLTFALKVQFLSCCHLSKLKCVMRLQSYVPLWGPSYAQDINNNHVRWQVKLHEIDCFLPSWVHTTNCSGKINSDTPMTRAFFVWWFKKSLRKIAEVEVAWPTVLKPVDLYLQSPPFLSTFSWVSSQITVYEMLRDVLLWFQSVMFWKISVPSHFVPKRISLPWRSTMRTTENSVGVSLESGS